MLTVTDNAIDAIRQLAPGDSGLRVYTSELPGMAGQQAFQVEVAQSPGSEDEVLDANGASVFLEPNAARLLDGKVLDATLDGTAVRFAIADTP